LFTLEIWLEVGFECRLLMTTKVVEVRNLVKRFGANDILRRINLEVEKGEVVGIIGPSGSGKTTLLRCVNFLEEYQEGEILVDGQLVGYRDNGGKRSKLPEDTIAKMRADVGMVFQSFNLFPHMTALDNVMLGLIKVRRLTRSEAEARATTWLERVGLADKFKAYPGQLSGGQQQRVGIARAVAMEPKLMLFDEVTSALDPELVSEVLSVVEDLAHSGMTMLIVTHEMRFAREIGKRIVFMDGGQIIEQGIPTQIFEQPKTERLQTFLNHLRYAK
jgi:polar amino acid transport system ATP-binding protein